MELGLQRKLALVTGAPHHAHYAAAKARLVNLTRSLARALAPRVRVNCVVHSLNHANGPGDHRRAAA
jgi:NAD(P)-dependent dehydrogenase (short-subunit alcohol dehydrogenase family)